MRFIAILVGGGLFVAVMAEGAYIIKQQKQLRSLGEKIEEIENAGSRDDGRPAADRGDPGRESDDRDWRRAPPPEFAPAMAAIGAAIEEAGGLAAVAESGTGSLPLPAVLATPQAREQLRGFINAQILAEREARRQEQIQKTEDAQDQRRADVAQKLGLSGSTARRFDEIVAGGQDKRRELLDKVREGQGFNDATRGQMRDLARTTSDELKALLGEEKFKQYEDMRGDGGRRGGWGGANGPGAPRGGGPTGSVPPGGAPTPRAGVAAGQ